MPMLRTIWDREICPTFRSYEFNPRNGKPFGAPSGGRQGELVWIVLIRCRHALADSVSAEIPSLDRPVAANETAGAAATNDNDEEDNNDYLLGSDGMDGSPGGFDFGSGAGFSDDDDDGDGDSSAENSASATSAGSPMGTGGRLPAVKEQAGVLQLAMDGGSVPGIAGLSRDALRGWAGPEHWRLRRLAQFGTCATFTEGGQTEPSDRS